jgi:transcriptional regulator with XRE-family HTH domain
MEQEILKQLLLLSGLSQKEFSEKTNIPEPRISEWMNGVRNPKISKLHEIAEVLGLKIELSSLIKEI